MTHMTQIREVVDNVIKVGYLTIEAEDQLRQLLALKSDLEDIDALMRLQQAATSGLVKQQSHELMRTPVS